MTHQLADETLAVILEACLVVPDKDFACTNAQTSPFSRIEQPSSNYLVVCKRWMRISTPLLYHTVVLRSQPQATALASVLKPKANARFGQYIRKFRVEGGFGVAVKNILLAAPNITDLCVMAVLSAKENVNPMCDVLLTAVHPQRLIIATGNAYPTMNKQTTRLSECLSQCIKGWNLTHLALSSEAIGHRLRLLSVIFACKTLQEISLSAQYGILDSACNLARRTHAPRILVPMRLSDQRWYMLSDYEKLDSVTKAKIIFAPEPEASRIAATADAIAATSNPFFSPLESSPEPLARIIWTSVLRAALALPRDVHQPRRRVEVSEDASKSKSSPLKPAMAYMLVCRDWLGIVQRIAAEQVVTFNPATLRSFCDYVATAKQAVMTSALIIRPQSTDSIYERPELTEVLVPQLERLSGLRRVAAIIGLSTIAWSALSRTSCSSLTLLDVAVTSGEFKLVRMPVLRSLNITTLASTAIFSADIDCVFPAVTRLDIRDHTADAALLRFLSSTRLPSLSVLTFDALSGFRPHTVVFSQEDIASVARRMVPFFRRHGSSLHEIWNESCSYMLNAMLLHCPNVTATHFRNDYHSYINPPPPVMGLHGSLQEMFIGTIQVGKDTLHPGWIKFFDSLQPETLPALKTVTSNQHNLWPTQPREVARHPMPPVAEALLERGIRLCDVSGVGWKPRLQTRRTKK